MNVLESMNDFREDNGFYATTRHPNTASYGNPIQLLSELLLIAKYNGASTVPLAEILNAQLRLIESENGLWHKKITTHDEITFDDLVPLACISALLHTDHAKAIHTRLLETGGVLSNTGEEYWTAHVRPWDYAFYCHMAGSRPPIWMDLCLTLSIALSAFFSKDPSSLKLMYIRLCGLRERRHDITGVFTALTHLLYSLAEKLWLWRIKKTWGSIKRVFVAYYGEKLPMVSYVPE